MTTEQQRLAAWERAQRNQQLGNVGVSLMQAIAASRPIQVGLGIGLIELLDRSSEDGIGDTIRDAVLATGMAGYLANSDGGVSLGFDVPDVQSPSPPQLARGGGGGLPR